MLLCFIKCVLYGALSQVRAFWVFSTIAWARFWIGVFVDGLVVVACADRCHDVHAGVS